MNRLAAKMLDEAKTVHRQVRLTELKGKTVLLTGASGMIGSAFLASMKGMVGRVIIVSKTSFPNYFNDLVNAKRTLMLVGDLTDQGFYKQLPRADYIIHCAGYAQPQKFLSDPISTITLNTWTVVKLMEKLNPDGKFLFISSSEIYSGLDHPPYKEEQIGTTSPMHPRSCYIESKRCGEAICMAYRQKGLDVKIARASLVYGPGTRLGDKRVLNSFIEKGLNGKIDLLDTGKSRRTYCYISDAVSLMWKILLKGEQPVYNVGGKSKITIGRLAKKIGRNLGVPVSFPKSSSSGLAGAPAEVYVNVNRAEKEFGKINYVSFDEGLRRVIEWEKLLNSYEAK
ncbi:MAG: NAD-dependent epimerase/dehydratase family protein [Patescibacteria group bacterium]|nr:NAD-dependent epimerase/dehydratase family protein [Patescibacteria group bacterium]MCL5431588.1 NAD-dependent epimerase/dehydratase family protein [Patescibacteria group bacterium]